MLRAPFPWFGDPMAYAKAHVHNGVLVIDDEGQIWRTAILNRGHWQEIPQRRAENVGAKGYLRVSLWVPREKRLAQVMAHNLIWEVKVGPIPAALELNHRDLCKSNNRLSNLELVTKPQNIQHSYAHGRTKPWTHAVEWRPGRLTLTAEQIQQIRRRRAEGTVFRVIAEEFGISITHAHRLCAETGGGR
jgi:hypothetical protein